MKGPVYWHPLLYGVTMRALYGVLGIAAPEALSEPLSHGGGSPEVGGTMRRAH